MHQPDAPIRPGMAEILVQRHYAVGEGILRIQRTFQSGAFQRADCHIDVRGSIVGDPFVAGAEWPVKPCETNAQSADQLVAGLKGKDDLTVRRSPVEHWALAALMEQAFVTSRQVPARQLGRRRQALPGFPRPPDGLADLCLVERQIIQNLLNAARDSLLTVGTAQEAEALVEKLRQFAGQGLVVAQRPADLPGQLRVGGEVLGEGVVVLEAGLRTENQVQRTGLARCLLGHDGIPFWIHSRTVRNPMPSNLP
ncbi:hypothetical protein D3C84_788680 [compost metagenome]